MDVTTICDRLIDDLEANVDLPPHNTWRYTEPRVTTPEACPLLAVHPARSDYQPLTTRDDYTASHEIIVAWGVDASYGADTGGLGDPETAAEAMQTVRAILNHARTWTTGLPGEPQVTATLDHATYDLLAGLIWRYQLHLRIDDIAL